MCSLYADAARVLAPWTDCSPMQMLMMLMQLKLKLKLEFLRGDTRCIYIRQSFLCHLQLAVVSMLLLFSRHK